MSDTLSPPPQGVRLPLNLGLNDGTYMPQACVDVMQRNCHRLALRNYTSGDNAPLRETIARVDGVHPDNIFLRNGSGPILKQVVPHIIRSTIKSSARRMARHVWNKNGCPIITPWFTYSKVPKKASEIGLTVHLMPLGPQNGFQLDISELERRLVQGGGFVYIANPNNPTGNVLVTREQIEPLLTRFPETWFWIDEAYVQYVDPAQHQPFSDLVPRYDNLIVARTFSFAYGLAGVRIGYMLGKKDLVAEMDGQLTDYRLGTLQEELAVAALTDDEHLPWLRQECARQRALIQDGLAGVSGIEVFDSEVNFLLCRFTDGRTGDWLKAALAARGVLIKTFSPLAEAHYEPYFRVTLGTEAENRFLVDQIIAVAG